jgi:cytochrome c oxidase subunit 3
MSLGSINTGVLLTSSLMVALAVSSVRQGNNRAVTLYLLAAVVLGTVFLGIKFTEYYLEWREGAIPWSNFRLEVSNPARARMFFVFYFVMTGLHATHMVIGVTILSVLAVMSARRRFSAVYYSPVEVGGLYWHFVDIVWVFLYPALYLLNPH